MDDAPDVTVVMSVYNGAHTLESTMESILSQEGIAFEFIVIDDGSSDATARLLDQYAARDGRVRVLHQENTGLTRALMLGCSLARAKFIARQDCGDISLPDRLRAQAAYLSAHDECVLLGCDYEVTGPQGELLDVHTAVTGGNADLQDRHGRRLVGPHHGTVMFRRDAYIGAGGYRAAFYFAQDLDLWSRLLEIGELGRVPAVLCSTIFDANGISGRHRVAQESLRSIILDAAAARRRGQDESAFLTQAALIRPVRGGAQAPAARAKAEADAAYFVGSCLFRRRDSRSRRYFLQTLRTRPFDFRSWAKLVGSLFHSMGGVSHAK